ncbi:MAG: hypothetical protein QN141_04340 [Armatimonadota bacterium]|nr:hypothetical protein [Armatimonadota bacterium]MDR7450593.1 hypothetical protein [Armatimonadota bacterium]MDR7466274.1 hypothetical protein [Armatimonadota bacterium]MDR7492995.1 hypothetical protein [Armatimonadota bacterium]MDR7498248.1 hypothetical protein [Armatimonadota bacterium]
MSLFRRLRERWSGAASPADAHAVVFYVRCDRCGEVVRVRADRRWDLVQELEDGVTGYTLYKDVLGTRCNQLMRMVVRFDREYRITHQDVEGGRFATAAEYAAEPSG